MFLVPSCSRRRRRTTALANVHSCFAKLLFKTARRGTLLRPTCSLRAGDNECRSYAMANRMVEPALVLGLVSVLALSTAAPSFAQTQRQRPSAQEQGLGQGPGPASPQADETFGQAPPRAQSRNPAAAQQSVRAGSPPTRTLASATGARAPIKGRARSNSGRLSRLMRWKAGPRARLLRCFCASGKRRHSIVGEGEGGAFVRPRYFSRFAASSTMLRSACFLTSGADLTKPRSRVMSTFFCSATRSGSMLGSW